MRAYCDECRDIGPLDPETGLCQSCQEDRDELHLRAILQSLDEEEYSVFKFGGWEALQMLWASRCNAAYHTMRRLAS